MAGDGDGHGGGDGRGGTTTGGGGVDWKAMIFVLEIPLPPPSECVVKSSCFGKRHCVHIQREGMNWIPFPPDDDRQGTKKLTITMAAVALAAALDAGRGRGGGSGGVAVVVDEDGGVVVAVVAMGFHSHLCRCSLHVKDES